MLGDKALELIKQLQRCDYLNPLQDEVLRQVFEEMKALFEENQVDVNASISGEMQYHAAVQLRHSVLLRNKRCVLTYLYNRLQMIRDIRWGFGAVLPADVRSCLSEAEVRCLCDYGDFETSDGNTVVLSKNSTHFLQRADCEKLIHQGILEHISV
ncbi:DNA replication complex GINS protein PSF1-like isoform X3 [Uloborus diversus]|uniref:DNA replication complex GINS protein PSF1-like isoform X3 n=1 Tax=Uloborus diversus TaxID=327109 RepID=UPI00240904E0|nr:DNA replication complex GINS protein PSF1-like isoform X3 [Uloborus diversus]